MPTVKYLHQNTRALHKQLLYSISILQDHSIGSISLIRISIDTYQYQFTSTFEVKKQYICTTFIAMRYVCLCVPLLHGCGDLFIIMYVRKHIGIYNILIKLEKTSLIYT